MSESQTSNVPHLDNVNAGDRKKIKSVSESAQMTSEQPAVVAPELATEGQGPIPEIGQDAQTGPEVVGAEDPHHDSVKRKKTLTEKFIGLFKKH